MGNTENINNTRGRREFLSMVSGAAALGLIGANGAISALSEDNIRTSGQPKPLMPTIALGRHRVSRLICGVNPINGNSYMGPHTSRHMLDYFSTESTVKFLQDCEQAGITAHQFSKPGDNTDNYLRLLRERGSKMQLFGAGNYDDLPLSDIAKDIDKTIEIAQPIAMVHHGGVTDKLFAEGNSQRVHDFVRMVKDKGLLAGVASHNPDVIKQIADEEWGVDFFMTCFYFLSRKLDLPSPTLQISSTFFKDDPLVMTQVIRQVKQPCLAFKILGAGRLCSDQETVRAAFQFAFGNIKPTDGIIVGMFPWYFDEIGANSQYTKEMGHM